MTVGVKEIGNNVLGATSCRNRGSVHKFTETTMTAQLETIKRINSCTL